MRRTMHQQDSHKEGKPVTQERPLDVELARGLVLEMYESEFARAADWEMILDGDAGAKIARHLLLSGATELFYIPCVSTVPQPHG